MTKIEDIAQRVNHMVDRLSEPLSEPEFKSGWTQESKDAMREFFARLRDDLAGGRKVADVPEYRSISRGMDHWGIVEGELLDEADTISAEIRSLTCG